MSSRMTIGEDRRERLQPRPAIVVREWNRVALLLDVRRGVQRVTLDHLQAESVGERSRDRRLAASRDAHDQDVDAAVETGHAGGGTSVGSGWPRTPAIRFAAAISAILPRVAREAEAICGTIRQLSIPTSGSSIGMGSGSVTSRAAAAITPSRNASAKATWSTTGPRDVLTSTAVGFIQARELPLMRCRVAGLRFTWIDTKSLSPRSTSSGRYDAPSSIAMSSGTSETSWYRMCIPNPWARRATA